METQQKDQIEHRIEAVIPITVELFLNKRVQTFIFIQFLTMCPSRFYEQSIAKDCAFF